MRDASLVPNSHALLLSPPDNFEGRSNPASSIRSDAITSVNRAEGNWVCPLIRFLSPISRAPSTSDPGFTFGFYLNVSNLLIAAAVFFASWQINLAGSCSSSGPSCCLPK